MKFIQYECPNFTIDRDFDSLFNFAFNALPRFHKDADGSQNRERTHSPKMDNNEDDNNYYLHFELPGVSRENIEINLENGLLTVNASRKKAGDKNVPDLKFSRSVAVPEAIKSEAISAQYLDGILTVILPKEEKRKPVSIKIN